MRRLALFSIGAIGLALPASAQVFTIGTTDARQCYLAAAGQDVGPAAMQSCDMAIAATDGRTKLATHVNRGILRLGMRDTTGALSDFDAAIAMNGEEPEAWLNKGVALVRAERAEQAIEALDRAITLGTQRPALAHFARAYAYEDQGRMSAAYRDLRAASNLSPSWGAPKRELRRFRVRAASGGGGTGAGSF